MTTIYFLRGAAASGKSYLGGLLEQHERFAYRRSDQMTTAIASKLFGAELAAIFIEIDSRYVHEEWKLVRSMTTNLRAIGFTEFRILEIRRMSK